MPSSVIAVIEYDRENSALRITFVSGMIYVYQNVPEEVYLAMKTSGNKGLFLNQHIKNHYPFEKLT